MYYHVSWREKKEVERDREREGKKIKNLKKNFPKISSVFHLYFIIYLLTKKKNYFSIDQIGE